MRKLIPIYAFLTALAMFVTISCNPSEEEEAEDLEQDFIASANTMITGFSLEENDSVLSGLDSVYFAINLDERRIYNPDSLPKGTDITRLLANISYESTATATIEITGATTMRDTTFTYDIDSTTDSIDFTGNVYLTIRAANGVSTREYRIDINVHRMEPDSLYWNEMARTALPSRTSTVLAQKTVQSGSMLFCLMEEGDGFTMASTDNPETNAWEKTKLELSFTPDLASLAANDNRLFVLDENGRLHYSENGSDWTDATLTLYHLIGGYNDRLLAVSHEDGTYYQIVYYPASGKIEKTEAESTFPVEGTSQVCKYTTPWQTSDQVFFVGGICADGSKTGAMWGYDGSSWGELSRSQMPARSDVTLFAYRQRMGSIFTDTEYPVWIAMGGFDESGRATKEVYVSFDNGINWKQGDELLQLPDYFTAFAGAQAYVYKSVMSETRATSHGSRDWTSYPSRRLPAWWSIADDVRTRVSAPVTSWECPYIYLFGGIDDSGMLQNSIWKGVINRLTFKPIV